MMQVHRIALDPNNTQATYLARASGTARNPTSHLPLSIQQWTCPACGAVHHCDVNTAQTLKNLAVNSTMSTGGEEGAGLGRKTRVKLSAAKQEVNDKSI